MEKQLLDSKVIDLLEYRIQQEESNARIYKDMGLWLEDKGFKSLASMYKSFHKEERVHAHWAEEFLLDYGYKPKLKIIPSPEAEYTSIKDILESTLEVELETTRQCQELTKKALEYDNYVLYTLGLKYLTEQQEEIARSNDVLSQYEHSDNDLFFDHYIKENYLD